MALMTMEREPEVARFIDTYKFDQDMATRRDRYGGGTSLPLNSDGYEDKQKVLRDERHKDWLQQQDKNLENPPTIGRHHAPVVYGPQRPADYDAEIQRMTDRYHNRYNEVIHAAHAEPRSRDAVYYRVGTPEEGFAGLGNYEKQRQEINMVRQKEYNDMLKKQRQMEQQKLDARRHRSPPRPAQPLGPQIDYNAASENARAEERRAYQDYMGKNYYPINVPQKPLMDYEENKKTLSEERKQEYNQFIEKKAKEERYWAMRGRPVTPPGGLNIGNYDRQVKETAAAKKKEYKEMLDQQKNEQLTLRAMDRVADVSTKYVKYRDQERPLVGSPRDINYNLREKEEKDKFRKDLKGRPKHNQTPPTENLATEHTSADVDSNMKAFIEVEREKVLNKRKYAEDLLKQQREHMYLRARQEPEISVLDRNGPSSNFLANKPPPGPGFSRARDEPKYQTPSYWNEGRQSRGPRSFDSDASRSNQSIGIPVEHKTQNKSRPIPERPYHGQPPYYGEGQGQNDLKFDKIDPMSRSPVNLPAQSPLQQRLPEKSHPRSPEKPLDPVWLRQPLRDDERIDGTGTPLAFKNESQSRPIPERPVYGQPPYPGEGPHQNDPEGRMPYLEPQERSRSPGTKLPRSPEKPLDSDWLRVPLRDDERPAELGTPLAFKTNSHPSQPPPRLDQPYSGPNYSQEGHKYENGPEGLFERPDKSQERPRSRRSLDVDRNYSQSKPEKITMSGNQLSPRRTKNQFYKDSEEVNTKRIEASKERQKEYNNYLKTKADERRRQEDVRHQQQQMSKPTEIVKNPFYSSDDYEKFQREIQRKQGEEYREFLSKEYTPARTDGLPIGQYRYEPKRLALEAERNKEYNSLLEKSSKHRNPKDIDGPQGLNIDVTYQSRKQAWLEKQRNKDYNEFVKKEEEQRRETRQNYNMEPPRTTYGSSFKHPPPSPHRIFHQTPPSPPARFREQSKEQDSQQSVPLQNGYTEHDNRQNASMPQQDYRPDMTENQQRQNLFPSNASDHGDYRVKIQEYPEGNNTGSIRDQMTAPYPKAFSAPPDRASLPATPSKLSLPVGQYDDMRPFIVKQRNKEYNSLKDKLGPPHIKRPKTPVTTALSLPVGQYDEMRPVFEQTRNKEYRQYLQRLPPPKKIGLTPKATDLSLPLGQYDKARPMFERQRNEEYNQLVETGRIGKRTFRQKAPTPPDQQGLPIGQQHYEPMHKAMEHQRNKEYNEFLQKKYGKNMRTTRSEPETTPGAGKASFYYGNEKEHEDKRKMLDEERKNEYNQFIKELDPPPSKSIDIPSDVDSGLPIGQQHHEAWKKFLRAQRNKEYNQYVDSKSTEVRNRDWNFEQNGVLELRGDDAVQSKQRELKAERQREYNNYMSQMKPSGNRIWPEPEGRGALLVKKGAYDSVRQLYDEERKRDLINTLQKRREMGLDQIPNSAPPEPLKARYNLNDPMVQILGKYDDFRKKLAEDRKKEFKKYMEQWKEEESHRQHHTSSAPHDARGETPLISSMGLYELETKKKMIDARRKEFKEYNDEKKKQWTPRTTVKENLMPHMASAETPLVNFMGHYDQERKKFRMERNKEIREFSEKKKHELRNPYDHFVYPTVAAAEKPLVAYMGTDVEKHRHDLRNERRHDYELFKEQVAATDQRVSNPSRRHEFVDTASGPYGGLFHGLGEHGNRTEVLNRERHQEYNEKLDQSDQQFGKDRPSGRPNWVKESLPNDVDRGRSPMRNQPDQYQQILDEKRREEASRRRYEDPEYQGRLAQGRDRGEAGQRYGY